MQRHLNKLRRSKQNPNRLNHGRAFANRAKADQADLPAVIQLFTRDSNPTAIGSRPVITVTFFIRAKRKARRVGGRIRMVAGFLATRAGLGFPKSHSVGRRITTDAGRVCAASVGFGVTAVKGGRRGWGGERARIMSDGRRSGLKRDSISAPAFRIGPAIIPT